MSHKDKENSKFSPREIKFLEIYFSGVLMKDAARAAGYKGASDSALCNTARNILTKYEGSAHPKEIFRRAGASETRIAQLLLDLAENATSESARVNALGILSKCMGLQREQVDSFEGAKIIIQPAPLYDDEIDAQELASTPSKPHISYGPSNVSQMAPRKITR